MKDFKLAEVDNFVEPLQFASFGIDIVLVMLGLYFGFAAMRLRKATGAFGMGLFLFCWALVLQGFVHMIETYIDILGIMNFEWNELLHRILVLLSFVIIIYGFELFKKDIYVPK